MTPVVKRIASTNDVFPAPRLAMTATFLRDLAPGSFIGPSLVVAEGVRPRACHDELHGRLLPRVCMMRQPTLVGKTDIVPVTDDEMIQYPNTEHLPCRNQPRGQHMIFLARCRITARMIVQKDDRSSGFLDGHRK